MRMFGVRELPLGIVTANIFGAFLMGVVVHVLLTRGLNHYAPFIMVGVLGGFTTFSSFSLEVVNLLEKGATGLAALYITVSVAGSVLGLLAGLWLMRSMTA